MKLKKKLLQFILLLAITLTVKGLKAQEFEVDGIKYNITNTTTKTVEVISKDPKYTGDITIPSTVVDNSETYSVTSIGENAFSQCYSLTSIVIPNSVRNIKSYAFYTCTGLISVSMSNTLLSIGSLAFQKCSGLITMNIPGSVTSIAEGVLGECTSLTSIIVDAANLSYSSEDGVLFNKGKTTLMQCPGGKEGNYSIPGSVTTINHSAFSDCKKLTSVTIPNSVTSIGKWAFARCRGLTSMIIPASLTSIGDCFFVHCSGLTSVSIPNSVTSIGADAFQGCSALRSVSIPNSVTSIGDAAFRGCTLLSSVVIPNSVTSIGDYCFSNCLFLTSVTISNSLTSIGDYTFSYCPDLTSVIIPNSVTSIGSHAFYECSKLNSVTISNSVTSIGEYAFAYCYNLTSVTIPNSVTSIEKSAFSCCYNLASVILSNSITSIGGSAFAACEDLKSISIPNTVTYIGDYAFSCISLASIICKLESPLNISENVFDVFKEWCILWVPADSIDVYKKAEVWKDFKYIKPIVDLSGISLNKTSLTIDVGAEQTLSAIFNPGSASDKTVIWSSSNKEIANVDHTGKVAGIKPGITTITAISSDGGYTATCNITVQENTTGFEDFSIEKAKIYPNPTTGEVHYKLQENSIQKIVVTDVSGRIILTSNIINKEGTLDLSGMKDGIYFINLYSTGKVISKRIIKSSN